MRLGMRELPRRGADLLRGAMRIAKVSRNRFEDDEADEADFSAFARLHSDSGFGEKLTHRPRAFATVARSVSPATSFILILLVLPLCLPLSIWLARQRVSSGSAGGAAQAKTRPIGYVEVSPSFYASTRAFPALCGKRARGSIRPRDPPIRPACHFFKWQLFSGTVST